MFCRGCGRENKPDAAFCLYCGTRMAALGEGTEKRALPEPRMTAAKPKRKKKVNKKKLWVTLLAVFLIAALALVGLYFYNRRDRYWWEAAYEVMQSEDGGYAVVYKGKVVRDEIPTLTSLSRDIYGKAAAFLDESDLYYARGAKTKRITGNVNSTIMAGSGKTVAYMKDGRLYQYNCLTKKSEKIDRDVRSYRISFNGEYVVYTTQEGLYLWNGTDSSRLAYGEDLDLYLWTVSDHGEVFVVNMEDRDEYTGTLYSFTEDGTMIKQGENIETYGGMAGSNRTRTQIMYYKDGECYISVNGEKGKKLDIPGRQAGYSVSVKNLYDQFYVTYKDGTYSLYYLDENWDAELIMEDVNRFVPAANGRKAYVVDTDGDAYCICKGSLKKDRIAKDIEEIQPAGLGMVYLVDEDGNLYRNNTKNKIARHVRDAQGTYGGGVFYLDEDGDLYSAWIFGKGREIDDEVEGFSRNGTDFVYYKENDEFYDRSDVYFGRFGMNFKKIRNVYD